ncbi:Eci2 [Symbiodinium sp. CCMP2592]|nr:Eci2 [Symbiodinium sp. CCMP2592]
MGTVDDAGRLQLIYDNILGLATAGVVTVLPSAEELAEGLEHLDLPPKDDAELSACLWVLEGALGECPAPSFEEFLMKATDLSHSPTASLGTNLSSDRPDCLQLAQGGSKGFPSPQSFFSSDDNDEDEAQEDQDRNRAMQTLRSSLQSSLQSSPPPVQLTFPEKGDMVSLLTDAVEQMSLLQREVKSSSALKLSSFIQDLLAAALNQAQELERNLATAVEGLRKSRELVQQSPAPVSAMESFVRVSALRLLPHRLVEFWAWQAMAALGEAEEPYKMSRILYQDAGNGVFVITLNDPARLNCMSLNLAQEVSLLLEHVKRDERCKVIVWTGAGRAFSAGGNFTDARTTVPEEVYDGYVRAGIATRLPDISLSGPTRAMIKLPKLSIAAVNGMAIGGGVNLALVWQDFVYVSQDAVFRYPFGELGLTPELGSSVLLPQVVGLVRAKELLQLGREFSAKEALEMGLCTAVVPQEEVLGKAIEAAKKLAAMPQFALRESKRLLNKDLVARIDSITEEELNAFKKVVADPETVKAMMSLAKRTSGKSKL